MIIQIEKTIYLQGRDISYVIYENDCGDLLHFYFGNKITTDEDYSIEVGELSEGYGFETSEFLLDTYPQEYPAYGGSDLRNPAFQILNKYNNAVSHLTVKEWAAASVQKEL